MRDMLREALFLADKALAESDHLIDLIKVSDYNDTPEVQEALSNFIAKRNSLVEQRAELLFQYNHLN